MIAILGLSVNTTDEVELQEAADLSIASKDTLLGYDGETFYSKLVSGEALAVMGWDGWCNYGTAEDPNVEWVLPQEGSDLWVDVMAIPKGSPHLGAAHEFIDFILEPDNGQLDAREHLVQGPERRGDGALDPSYLEDYPNMAIEPSTLLAQEALRDLGEGQAIFTQYVSEVKAA